MERKLFMVVISMLVPLLTGVLAQPVSALEIRRGEAIQGGLVLLQAKPGSTLTAAGEMLMVSAAGLAVVGFHRDDTAAVEVIATAADGSIETLTLTPKIREYQEQRIDGLQRRWSHRRKTCWRRSHPIGRWLLTPVRMQRHLMLLPVTSHGRCKVLSPVSMAPAAY